MTGRFYYKQLCVSYFSKLKAMNKIVKNKKLKARKKDPKSRSHLKSRENLFVSATCHEKRNFICQVHASQSQIECDKR